MSELKFVLNECGKIAPRQLVRRATRYGAQAKYWDMGNAQHAPVALLEGKDRRREFRHLDTDLVWVVLNKLKY